MVMMKLFREKLGSAVNAIGLTFGCAYRAFKSARPEAEISKRPWQHLCGYRLALAGLVITLLMAIIAGCSYRQSQLHYPWKYLCPAR